MTTMTLTMVKAAAVAPVAPKVIQYYLYRVTEQNILNPLIRVITGFHELHIECATCSAL